MRSAAVSKIECEALNEGQGLFDHVIFLGASLPKDCQAKIGCVTQSPLIRSWEELPWNDVTLVQLAICAP